eukprot:scaffold14337_cov132-Isochrysis_galbana.AAC.3
MAAQAQAPKQQQQRRGYMQAHRRRAGVRGHQDNDQTSARAPPIISPKLRCPARTWRAQSRAARQSSQRLQL